MSVLLLTGGKMFYAPVGETIPDGNTIGVGVAWGGNWASLGDLTEVALLEESSVVDRKGGKMAPTARMRQTSVFSFQSSLQEFSAAMDALVRGYDPAAGTGTVTTTAAGASQVGVDRFQPGANSSCSTRIPEWAVGIEGVLCTETDNYLGYVRAFITKGNFMPDGNQAWNRESDGVVQPFIFKGLADPAQPGDQHYFIDYVTAGPTS